MIARTGTLYTTLRSLRNRANNLKHGFRNVHSTASVHRTAKVSKDIRIEEYGFIGNDCHIGPGVTIGRYSMLAPRVAIVGDDHIVDDIGTPAQFSGRPAQRETIIGRDAWIGYGATIMRGVRIGEGAIVGAGAVVTKDVPDYEIWAGTPARSIRRRMNEADAKKHTAIINGTILEPTFAETQTVKTRP